MPVSDPGAAQAHLEAAEDLGLPMPSDHSFCARADGLIRMATVGLDFTALVSAADRLQLAPLQRRVGRLVIYFVCTRPRIRAVASGCKVDRGTVTYVLERWLSDGTRERMTFETPVPATLTELRVEQGGQVVREVHGDQREVLSDAAFVAREQMWMPTYEPSAFDLKVHYIGRARGREEQSCALDRLENHEKYQCVLEQVLADENVYRDVWLVLGSGTTIGWINGHLDKEFPVEKLRAGLQSAHETLTENDRIDLTEAMFINHFKPPLNKQHVKALSLNGKLLTKCRQLGMTGLKLGFETSALGNVALYTDHVPHRMFHELTVCLDGQAPQT